MNIPLIGGDKIRSLIKNATKDSSTGSNESLMKTNTRDSNNMIKDSDQLEMDRKNKVIMNNLKNSGGIIKKPQELIGGLKKSEGNNMGGGINTNLQQKPIDTEITKTRGFTQNTNNETVIPNQGRLDITMSEEEKNKGRLGNEYMGAEYYTKNSEEMGKAVNDLYKVVNNVLNAGQDVNIGKIREKFPEFGGIDDDVLNNMIVDVKTMINDGNDNLKELVDVYPELGYISNIDLGYNGRVELINGMLNDDDGILDWVLDKLGVGGLVERKTGKSIKENLSNWANSSHEKKKTALNDNELEDAFVRDLQERYKQYTNNRGEWLPDTPDEIKKQYKKEWDKYEYKGVFRAMGNFFKGLPSYLELGYNMVNHLPEMVKALGQLGLGLVVKGGEKLDDVTRLNGLDKRAQARGYENWDEMKEIAYENMGEKGGWFNEFILGSDLVTDKMLDYFDDTYGGMLKGDMTKVTQNIQERGEDILSDAMMVLDAVNGVGKVTGLISPETSSKLRQVSNLMDPASLGVNIVTGGTKALAKAEGKVVTKALGKGMKAISGGKDVLEKSFIGRGAEMVINQLTNLTKEERDFIKNNYDIVEEYLRGNRNAEDIAELIRTRMDDLLENKRGVGDFYDFIKNNDKAIVKTAGAVDSIKKMLDNMGIKVGSDGTLKFGDLSYTPAQQRQLQQVYSYIRALENLGDNATAKDVRRARQLIDSLADWEGHSRKGLDAEVTNSIRDMRSKIDDALKEQVQGFKEADTEYRELSNLVKELRKDWFDKEGNLKDSSLSKIRNLTRAGNEAKLERLEKHFPSITESLKGLAVAQSVEKAGKAMVGQYAKQVMTVGGIFGLISGDLSLATALLGMAILTPKNLVKILKMQNNFENVWKRIANKLDNGEVLSARDNGRLKKRLRRNELGIRDNVEEAMKSKDWEQIDMDLVDKEYQRAQDKAYIWSESTEKKLTKEEIDRLDKKYEGKMKDIGFVRDVEDGMLKDNLGYSKVAEKLYNWRKDVGDTTRQHEFFHSVFSVVDEKTYRYVLDEARKYLDLDESVLGKKTDEVAEDWLAESFGVYIRRQEIKNKEIRLKGNRLQRFNSQIRDLFQRAYEWIQGYIVDRDTIDKLFDEVYNVKLDETGKLDLAEKLGINEKTPKLGVNENGLRYKKAGNLGKNDYKETAVKAQHDVSFEKKTPLTAVKGQNFNDSGLFGGNKDGKGNYIVKGGKNEQIIYTKVDKNGKAKFSGYKMKLQEKNRKYYDNVVDALNRFEKRGYNGKDILIGKTPRGNDIFITDKDLVHIFKEHGEFYIENLIESVNDGRDGFWETKANKRYGEGALGLRPRMEIEIPGKNENFIVGLMSDGSDEFNSTRYNVKSLRESKPSQVESRGGVKFKKDIYNDKGYTKPEYRYDPRSSLPTVRGGWTKAKIEKYLRNSAASSPKGVYTALSAIREFDSVDDFKNHVFYHGTQGAFVGRPTMSIPEKTFDKYADRFGGGYGQRYWAISLTTDKKIASNFGGASSSVNINPVILRKDAKVIEMPQLTDSIELDSHIEKLWNDGVDAVWIGDKNAGEKELAVINPKAIVNVDNADSYRQYHLGMNDNPLKISTDADFKRIYDDAPRLQDEIDTTQKAYMDYEKEGLERKGVEKYEIGEEGWLEKSKKEREAKNEIREEEGYQGLHRKYSDAVQNARSEVRWKKDNTGKELSQAQQDFFKDSKVRDKSGKLLRMYHGTPDKGFTVFKEGYFTPNKEYADTYQSTTASSIKFNKKGANPGTYEVYLNIKNPFDTRDAKAREIFEKEYFGNYGMGTQLGEKGLPDWMDGTDLQEFLMEKHPEYDGLILDEGGIGGYGEEVKDRGLSYVPFESNQIKNVDNLNPTKSEDIRYKKDQTKTPEFRRWFEGSKVVKADGKPQIVYHGTTADFNVFNKIGGAGIYGDGYYFTDKIGTAKNYGADGGKVMKVYLDIKNPYEATMKDQYGLNVKKLKEQGYDGVKAKLGNETYWVAFDSNQIKSATDNVGTFDKNNPDIRYKKDANEGQGLIAIHNTSMEKLAKSKNLGGIVAPSVAITKEGVPFENYGEISFIGNKDLVKPGKSTVVGETDLYSPRVPKPTLERKDGVTREMRDEFAKKMGMREAELESYLFEGGGTYYERTYPKLAEEIEPLITKKLFKGFTDMGDRIYEPYNMKNIIKEMFSEGDVGAESSMFQGSLSEAMARMSDEVTDFEKVRGKIVDGGYDMKKLDEKYDKLSDKYMNYGWDVLEGREGMGIFSENIKRSNSAIVAELADYGIDVTEKQVQKLKDMVKEGLDLPKGYVEAKIKRGVGFDEFSAVVVPEDKVAQVKKLIDNPNIEVYGYKEGERMKVIQEVAKKNNLRFKKGLNKKLGSVGVMNSKGNVGGLSRKGLGTMAKGLRYKQQQDLKN